MASSHNRRRFCSTTATFDIRRNLESPAICQKRAETPIVPDGIGFALSLLRRRFQPKFE
jgi:hypothetical protein